MTETLRRFSAPSTVVSPGLTVGERWRRSRLLLAGRVWDALLRLARCHPTGWRWLAGRHHPVLDRLAEANARAVCALAALDVPAYRAFLRGRPAGAGPARVRRRLGDFPETDKENYVVPHDAARRRDGPGRGGEEHRPRPRQDRRHAARVRPGLRLSGDRVPAVPEAPAGPARRRRVPWASYRISASCGGEGMTEALRGYLEERFLRVRSACGASDLTIGIGAETAFTVWLRRRLWTDLAFRATVLGEDEQRLPMVFQYNPLATYLETNRRGELLCTLTSLDVLQPRLRYNVGDEALLLSYRRVLELVRAAPARAAQCRAAIGGERTTLPLLLLFGRRDSTVSYLGANLYPQDVEYGLYAGNPYAAEIGRFCLALAEDSALETRPVVHLELRRPLAGPVREALAAACRAGVRRHLAEVSRDFAQSLTEDPTAGELRVELHEAGTGPFAGVPKIKNVYLAGG